jgi:hypothetical protein
MVERKLFLSLCAVACLLMAPGCASPPTYLGQNVTDPPQLSPYNQLLNASAPPAAGDQQITGYRGLGSFFGPWMSTPAAPQGRFQSGAPSGGPQPVPTPMLPAPTLQRGPIELGQPQPAGPEPTDELGTQLGAPRTYREDGVPTYPDPQATPDNAGETIRRRPDADSLQAPPAESAPDQKTYDPATQPLELEVNDPQQVLRAETADFEVVIRNPFSEAVEDVVIVVRFDEGLSFPGLPDRALRQRLGTLGASESRTLDLPLTAETTGRRCVDFTLSAGGRADTNVQRCVQVVDSQISAAPIEGTSGDSGGIAIELVGPPERNAGGRLECLLTIHNQSGQEVSAIMATIHHDTALVPREASAGALRGPGTLAWDLGLLRIDERVQIQVEFACPTPSEQACIDAQVTGRNLPTRRQELCVAIRPRPTLDVAIADVRDPVPVGETTTYLLTLTNRGLEPIVGARIEIEVDGGLELLSAHQPGSTVSQQTRDDAPRRTATYAISQTIAPDESEDLLIDVRGTAVGTAGLRVTATELASGRRFQVEEPTVVNPPLLELPSFDDIAGNR